MGLGGKKELRHISREIYITGEANAFLAKMLKCECGFRCDRMYNLERHRASERHERKLEEVKRELSEVTEDGTYTCTFCAYSTKLKSNFKKHVLSSKHQVRMAKQCDGSSCKTEEKVEHEPAAIKTVEQRLDETTAAIAKVSAEMKTLTSAKVAAETTEVQAKPVNLMDVMELFLKSHTDIILKTLTERVLATQHLVPQQQPQQPPIQQTVMMENNQSNSQNTSNSHNKKFNLNFFLNEECKNAQNLSDFVKNVVISMEDLEHLGDVGFTEGMTKILTKAMKEKEKTDRPMHCSDVKRDTIYVRKNNAWEKDDDNEETATAIKHIAHKNMKALNEWSNLHPESTVADTHDYNRWQDISRKTYSSDPKVIKKLVHHLAMVTAIDKREEDFL